MADDRGIHPTTINRWMREMPHSVETFTTEWAAEQAAAEAEPTVAELEEEAARPVPPPPEKPEVQWPTAPIERRPVDHERVRRGQADWS